MADKTENAASAGLRFRRTHFASRPDGHGPNELDRRELLIAVSTIAAAFGLPGTASAQPAATLSTMEFASLSSAIAGFPPADPDLAASFLEAFSAQAGELAKLYEIVRTVRPDEWEEKIAAEGLAPLAEALTTAWYTGTVGDGADQRVLTYLDAFAWYAVAYTKPPTHCDISFGAWSEPPREVR